MSRFNTLINLIHNPDKSVTLTFPDEDKLVRSVTGPLSAIKDYTWKAMCRYDEISPASLFCVFSRDNPWVSIHSEIVATLFEERRNEACQAK